MPERRGMTIAAYEKKYPSKPVEPELIHDGRFIMGDGRSQTYLLTERLGQFRTHCPCGWQSEWADEPPYSALDEHQAQPLASDDSGTDRS